MKGYFERLRLLTAKRNKLYRGTRLKKTKTKTKTKKHYIL